MKRILAEALESNQVSRDMDIRPTEVTQMLIEVVRRQLWQHFGIDAVVGPGMQARIVRAPLRAATPLHPCRDPRLQGSGSVS